MPTPNNAPYKLIQRQAENSKYNFTVLHLSMRLEKVEGKQNLFKRIQVQGQRIVNPTRRKLTKAEKKQIKKYNRTKKFEAQLN